MWSRVNKTKMSTKIRVTYHRPGAWTPLKVAKLWPYKRNYVIWFVEYIFNIKNYEISIP